MRRFRNTIRQPRTTRRPRQDGALPADATVDLHGQTADAALRKLDTVLADGEIHTLLVIHGKGEGILRQRVRAFLRAHPEVREIRPGEEARLPGGDGVTWCRLS